MAARQKMQAGIDKLAGGGYHLRPWGRNVVLEESSAFRKLSTMVFLSRDLSSFQIRLKMRSQLIKEVAVV